jgi:hypothetical protein
MGFMVVFAVALAAVEVGAAVAMVGAMLVEAAVTLVEAAAMFMYPPQVQTLATQHLTLIVALSPV